ncbi:MAG TPA: tRNA uridine-5-carboxymethylaminomethyl(34) synthesis GTPase MnmE [Allosphingosinicella sp.]|uniref:tRNA uridine-5-carboxymethylaminomethyl(34) synthesis GTPase MnmE n=1 Tax=Allosphingosinicella sp. TaxID=2823234 RepID=UPI002F280C95
MNADTIFALSSGQPPAAIAIVRLSGPAAASALETLAGLLPVPRTASLRTIAHPATGEPLDRAILLFFPGPDSATGEDIAELHLHGGRSVVAAVLDALGSINGLRSAQPGEFTRRAFENGRMDLAEAEGLADLLAAETQSQRRAALALAGGALSRRVEAWQDRLLQLAAAVESLLDFSDEGDVGDELPTSWTAALGSLTVELDQLLRSPPAERLRDGIRVVIAGPPNAGKSSLLNWLAGRRAAITSAIAGTTRDLIEAPTAIGGAPFLLVDTAGLREGADAIEAEGVSLARASMAAADLILWLGDPHDCPDPARSILVASKADLYPEPRRPLADIHVSAETGEGMDALIALMVDRGRALLPREGEVAVNARHRAALADCVCHLHSAANSTDLLIVSESLRLARASLDRITGRAGVEDMLDRLFSSFCIGK